MDNQEGVLNFKKDMEEAMAKYEVKLQVTITPKNLFTRIFQKLVKVSYGLGIVSTKQSNGIQQSN